jgi:ABC-type sugar transport system substrate-binding protein
MNYPDVTGIFVGVSQCLGVIERLQQMELIDKFKIITVDTYQEIMEHLKSGNIAASLDRRPFKMGQTATHVLYQYLVNGVRPEPHIYISPTVVLPATADEYVQDDTGPLVDIVL